MGNVDNEPTTTIYYYFCVQSKRPFSGKLTFGRFSGKLHLSGFAMGAASGSAENLLF
jgi:hypothetical protein